MPYSSLAQSPSLGGVGKLLNRILQTIGNFLQTAAAFA